MSSDLEASGGRRARWVVVGLTIGLLVLFTVAFLIAESLGYEDEGAWRSLLSPLQEGWGPVAVAGGLIGVLMVDLALPVPSSLVMTLSGALLGAPLGFVVNLVGSLLAAWLGWGLCLAFGERAFARLVGPDLPGARAWFHRWGSWGIVLSRSVPMLTEIVSCLAGLHGVGFWRFTALTLAGAAPISLVYALAGAAGWTSVWVPAVVALGLPGLGYAVLVVSRRRAPSGPSTRG